VECVVDGILEVAVSISDCVEKVCSARNEVR